MTDQDFIAPIDAQWKIALSVDSFRCWEDLKSFITGLAAASIWWTKNYYELRADLDFLRDIVTQHQIRCLENTNGL